MFGYLSLRSRLFLEVVVAAEEEEEEERSCFLLWGGYGPVG